MALLSERERLRDAWTALGDTREEGGWRAIPIRPQGSRRMLVGRHFPGNEEAVLIGFRVAPLPPAAQLPQGRGFRIERLPEAALKSDHDYIAMYRQPSASLELFSLMVEDVIGLLDSHSDAHDSDFLQLFLGRIRAWQEFMHEARSDVLGKTAETGLAGELLIVSRLLDAGLPAMLVLGAWEGPLGGLHDFALGSGAIEVKATVNRHGFPATVGSLEQLDPLLTSPLYLAAVRFRTGEPGASLPEMVEGVADRISKSPGAGAALETLLLRAGYLNAHSGQYSNRFHEVALRFMLVDSGFPGLHRGCVATPVTGAQYAIDLDLVSQSDCGLGVVLDALGVAS